MPRLDTLWPRRLKAPLAAHYLGISTSKFLSDVERGKYPRGEKDGHNRLWYREDLDRALDRGRGRALYDDLDEVLGIGHER